MRLGAFGGAFNPPHLAHVVCAREARRQLELDRVLLVPVATPPHKSLDDDPGPRERLALVRAAVADEPGVQACDLEVRRGGISYTVDTLDELADRHPGAELVLILGADQAAELGSWHRPERVVELATVALAERPGASVERGAAVVSRLGGRVRRFAMPQLEISSTAVRERSSAGEPIGRLVPDPVARAIDERGLYRGGVRSSAAGVRSRDAATQAGGP